ncbi:hypothetical protein LSAT2_021641 [Lamellibrachia satsuma]|nr:hypothetical protein LSAT2_021641 [Lamellibrachia satsuma]
MSDRIAVIQLRLTNNSLLTIINVYDPASLRVNNNNAEQDEFFAELARLTSRYPSIALLYIAGDFNSKIGYSTKILWKNIRAAEGTSTA